MISRIRTLGVFALLPALALLGAGPVPSLPVPPGAAMILDAGTGDYAGYRIVVDRIGHAQSVDGAGIASGLLQPELVDRFFADLDAAPPATTRTCAPPERATDEDVNADISIAWKDRAWRGLRCADAESAQKLSNDALAIARALYVGAYRMRPIWVHVGNYSVSGSAWSDYTNANGYGGYSKQPFTTFASASPYTTYPYGSPPAGGLPTTSLAGTLPVGALPYTNPYVGLPSSGLPSTSPFTAGPFTGLPYGSL